MLRASPAQRRSRQTIITFLNAAEELIVEEGQVSFTCENLAARAGTSIGRIYYWFPHLPAIHEALIQRIESDTEPGCGIESAVATHPSLVVFAVDGSSGLQNRALDTIASATGIPPGDPRCIAVAALHLPWLPASTRAERVSLTDQLVQSRSPIGSP